MKIQGLFGQLVAMVSALALAAGLVLSGSSLAVGQGRDGAGVRLWDSKYVDRGAGTVTADYLPTAEVWPIASATAASEKFGFVGGEFTQVRDVGGSWINLRGNLMAFDIETGQRVRSFNPYFNGKVKAMTLSPDQKTLYVGGEFSWAGRDGTNKLVAFDISSPDPGQWGIKGSFWSPGFNDWVGSLAANNTNVFVVGGFSYVGGHYRTNVAALTDTGAVTSWHPQMSSFDDMRVWVVAINPQGDRVFIGGAWDTISGVKTWGLAQIGATSADWNKIYPMQLSNVAWAWKMSAGVLGISATRDTVYASYFLWMDDQGKRWGNFEGTGANNIYGYGVKWIADCHGDSTVALAMNDTVYVGGHPHDCVNIGSLPFGTKYQGSEVAIHSFTTERSPYTVQQNTYKTDAYGNFGGHPAPYTYQWYPYLWGTDQAGNDVKALAGNGKYLLVAGSLNYVNGAAVHGILRFGVPTAPGVPKKQGPTLNSTFSAEKISGQNAVVTSWSSSQSKDDYTMRYVIYRDGRSVHEEISPGVPFPWWNSSWQQPGMDWVDRTVQPGRTYIYSAAVIDRDGNRMNLGESVSVKIDDTVTASGTDAISRVILADGPDHYWPMDNAGQNRPAKTDLAAVPDLILRGSAESGVPGITGAQNSALFLDGSTASGAWPEIPEVGSPEFTISMWIRPERPGRILALEGPQLRGPESVDKAIYIDDSGRLGFATDNGAYSGGRNILTSAPIQYGKWYHVAATVGPGGKKLYLNGNQVAANPNYTRDAVRPGWWLFGAVSDASLPPGVQVSQTYRGAVDNVATYDLALSPDQIKKHAAVMENVPPVTDFGVTCDGLTCEFQDFSTDVNFNMKSWSWSFGNGSTSTSRSPKISYAAAGSYVVTLKVTDDEGLSSERSMTIRVLG